MPSCCKWEKRVAKEEGRGELAGPLIRSVLTKIRSRKSMCVERVNPESSRHKENHLFLFFSLCVYEKMDVS